MHFRRVVMILAALTVAVAAQQYLGGLAGTVTDPAGERIAGAAVVAQATSSSQQRTASADSQGQFQINGLPPDTYNLTVTATGFAPAHAQVAVAVGVVASVAVSLRPGTAEQTVNVRASGSSIATQPLSTNSAVLKGVITSKDLQTIPLAMRSFANIAYLTPGTEPVEPSDPTKARITAVSFGGSSGLNVAQTVDGAINTDDYIGGFLENFSPDSVQEFTVSTAGESASTGGTTLGSVAIATKRGTNEWHGLAAFYERAAALNARFPLDNPAPNPKQPFSRQDYVGNLGGPLVKDRLWVFGSLEYVDENASIAYNNTSLTQFAALNQLAQQGLLPGGVTSVNYSSSAPIPFHDLIADTRLDWSQSPSSQWYVRLSGDSYLTNNDLVQQGALPNTGATAHSNYFNGVVNQQEIFSPTWLGSFTFSSSYLHHTEERNGDLGYALAFPFSTTPNIISGFETFGDNQFITPITAFPILRNQEEYQFSYSVSHNAGNHNPSFGVQFIHEPVLSGSLTGTAENLTVFPLDPTDYVGNPAQFTADLNCAPNATPGTTCTSTPASNGSFSQNVQRLGLWFQDDWHVNSRFVLDYGLRYDTTFGLFMASDNSQLDNPALLTLKALQVPVFQNYGAPQDDRGNFAPRLGLTYAFGKNRNTVFRAGAAMMYNDLAQNGWVPALQAVNTAPQPCNAPVDPGCLPGAANGGAGFLIDPDYHTPYALQATAGVEHAFSANWTLNVDFAHEEGNHAFRRYQYEAGYDLFSPLAADNVAAQQALVPNITVYRTDNRSRYDALMFHLQGNITNRLSLITNYTYSGGYTWGCVLGELFDYVNGVCNPDDAFGPGDFGPSGEDVRHRLVIAGNYHAPEGFVLSTMAQFESARPFTMTTPVSVNGLGDNFDDRAVINGVQTTLDEFRGEPYAQVDLRIERPFTVGDKYNVAPFVEMFNIFNRSNAGAFYATSLAALPTPVNSLTNATAFCLNAACTNTQPITNLNQLRFPEGAFGDFFGPGTTVGIPFAAQLGLRVTF